MVIGKRLGTLDAQAFAHLPCGWSILYYLARLERTALEALLKDGTVHPGLTLQRAKMLVAKYTSQRKDPKKSTTKQRIHKFKAFVLTTLTDWSEEDRDLAKAVLNELLGHLEATANVSSRENVSAIAFAHAQHPVLVASTVEDLRES